MSLRYAFGWSAAFCLSAVLASAQEVIETEKLQRQLVELQQKFDQQQQEMRASFERMIRQQQAEIDALRKQMAGANSPPSANGALANTPPAAGVATNAVASAEEVKELRERVDELTTASKRTSVSQFNPGLGFAVDTIFSYSSKGQDATGAGRAGGWDAFLRTAELNLEATVDPFARVYGVVAATADAQTGEATLGVEEAAIVTTSLPWNLTAQGGRFFADFGRLSYVHDHDLPFVSRPLVLDRYIGGESRTDGVQVNYLFPIDHYLSLTVGGGDQFGGDLGPTQVAGYRSVGKLNTWAHLSTYFDLTPDLNLETGVSGLVNDRAEGIGADPTQRDRYLAAADLTLRYQPLDSSVYRGWVWGTEILHNIAHFQTDPGLEASENAWGLYSYFETKLSRRFKVGFLFDWFEEPANPLGQTFRYSPYVTWNPSEFQLLRLQFSHTDPNEATGRHSSEAVYLQWSAIIGRHVHGFKQR